MKRSLYLLAVILLAKFLLQYFVLNPAYDLHRDEYLHLNQAGHLAAGYLSVPPFTAFVSLLIMQLGGSAFWVKFIPALFGVLTMLVVWDLIRRLSGGWFAQVLAAAVFFASAMTRIHMLYQPNGADILCWTLIFWLLVRYIQEGRPGLLLWIGVVAGVGILNKYNILFLIAGLLPAVLFFPIRKVLLHKYFYGALLLCTLIVLPNLIWQLQNALPVLHHMKELQETQLVNVDRAGFLLEQLFFFPPGFLVWITALVAFWLYAPFRPYRVIGVCYLFVMLLFLYLQAKGYYTLGLYPVLIAFGAVCWESWLSSRIARVVVLVLMVLPFALLFQVIFPVLPPEELGRKANEFRFVPNRRWEDGKVHDMPQDFADMLGWRDIAALAAKGWAQVPDRERRYTIILCDDYGEAGAVNYYNRGKGMPAAIAFDADYIFWFPKIDTIHYIIFIGEQINPDTYVRKRASTYTTIGRITDPLSRSNGATCSLLQGIVPEFPAKLREWQAEKKANLRAW